MTRLFAAFLFVSMSTFAAHPLASRTLVVYTSNTDSTGVAQHYQTARGIPSGNMCQVSTPDAANTLMTIPWTYWTGYLKPQIQACLNSAGTNQILYIVLAYLRALDLTSSDLSTFYALDSYITDIWDASCSAQASECSNPYYAANDSLNGVWVPFKSTVQWRATYGGIKPTGFMYSVWRLDGSTTVIANGLVDQAVTAENAGGLGAIGGTACIDARGSSVGNGYMGGGPDSSYNAVDLDLYRAQQFVTTAGLTLVYDINPVEFGTAPAPLTCTPTQLYAGWYSFNNYNGASVFAWQTGAIGYHLDSSSAQDPRGPCCSGSNWSFNALNYGITVTHGAVNEPFTTGFARPSGVFKNLLQDGANVGDAFFRNLRFIKFMMVNIGDPLYTPFPKAATPPSSATVRRGLQNKKGVIVVK